MLCVTRKKLDVWNFCCYTFLMAGRKKKPEGESKTYMLRIRMTEEERKLLESVAKSRSLETSTWARSELVLIARKISARPQTPPG